MQFAMPLLRLAFPPGSPPADAAQAISDRCGDGVAVEAKVAGLWRWSETRCAKAIMTAWTATSQLAFPKQ
eukprot:CAMPEP_0172676016 /NCGR_PEP_ID=MMETSP1074-20121228/13654_1 /TAXON_ID=2916 /ORGANISM="Ceratium fusus, Strain PA161109" /LENGTH=69 /DNA_ID=CAMNT_0013493569 /DNA_START=749 /DNA_END=959 /DNA_ORIENTATION=-